MRHLTEAEKKNLKKLIRNEMNAGLFTMRMFAVTYSKSQNTIKRLIIQDKKLQKEYESYIEFKRKQRAMKVKCSSKTKTKDEPFVEEVSKDSDKKKGTCVVTTKSLNIKTVEDALRIAEVDMGVWEVDRHLVNSWEVTIGARNAGSDKCETFTNFQIKIWLKRKHPDVLALEDLYEKMKSCSPVVPVIERPDSYYEVDRSARELEISLADLHLGLRCFEPASSCNWTPDDAEHMTMMMLDELLILTKHFGPYEKIVFPMGNDFLHCDNVYGETTSRTPQPEADAWQNTFLRGEKLGLAIIERLKKEAPVKIIAMPGNHARHSEIALSRIFSAYYHNDKNVGVDAALSPYKFHRFGVNLIGFEHGHSIRNTQRLTGLMANECRLKDWQEARYCEWHLGDQHRKGSGRPSVFAEQGVSIEFLPGLVPPNEWHKLHAFNWQKRAGMAFVWDKTAGPLCRFQVNIDNYSGKIMR